MNVHTTDLTIVGAGPVGLMCAHLARHCGLRAIVLDRNSGPLAVGRADALNARTLQLLAIAGLFDEVYPLGKPCNTSSIWSEGRFVSRNSSWWESLEGCFHRHFLMLGQAHLERILDDTCRTGGVDVRRNAEVVDVEVLEDGCRTTLADGQIVVSPYVIGADGSRSMVRDRFRIPFEPVRPEITWAVLDGVISTDFPKVPEIIVFQNETADVSWIPREGHLDRFYVRMDRQDFTLDEVIARIERAVSPHALSFREIVWFSRFSVKEAVAERFCVGGRVFLAGDACHVHSVNGGQGLNTGLGDAFNLVWKLHQVLRDQASPELLDTYESERRPVALSVVASSGELVRATKFSDGGTHGRDYLAILEKRAGNVTGMGVRHGEGGLAGTRVFDFLVRDGEMEQRLYQVLDYARPTLLCFGALPPDLEPSPAWQILEFHEGPGQGKWWASDHPYAGKVVLVRPDGDIAWIRSRDGDVPG
ncbi:MAG: FAD-binding protein [bacterium]|nr:FAD-binding protein [bacterium]